jgi:hypothetical protein
MPEVFDVVENLGGGRFREQTIVGCDEDGGVCDTDVKEPSKASASTIASFAVIRQRFGSQHTTQEASLHTSDRRQ